MSSASTTINDLYLGAARNIKDLPLMELTSRKGLKNFVAGLAKVH